MRELFTSTDFYIGFSVLAIAFVLNEIYPMISRDGMRLVAVGIGVITWLSYRGFLT